MGHGVADAFTLAALHVLCPLHDAAARCQRNLELAHGSCVHQAPDHFFGRRSQFIQEYQVLMNKK